MSRKESLAASALVLSILILLSFRGHEAAAWVCLACMIALSLLGEDE